MTIVYIQFKHKVVFFVLLLSSSACSTRPMKKNIIRDFYLVFVRERKIGKVTKVTNSQFKKKKTIKDNIVVGVERVLIGTIKE